MVAGSDSGFRADGQLHETVAVIEFASSCQVPDCQAAADVFSKLVGPCSSDNAWQMQLAWYSDLLKIMTKE